MAVNETSVYVPDAQISGTMPVYSEPEIFASGNLIPSRQVVGRITASRKVVPAVKTATDGSQKPIGISMLEIDAISADASGPVFKAGCFDPSTLVIDPTFTAEEVRLAFEGTPIFLREALKLY